MSHSSPGFLESLFAYLQIKYGLNVVLEDCKTCCIIIFTRRYSAIIRSCYGMSSHDVIRWFHTVLSAVWSLNRKLYMKAIVRVNMTWYETRNLSKKNVVKKNAKTMRATSNLWTIFVAILLHLCYDKGVTKFVTTAIFDVIFVTILSAIFVANTLQLKIVCVN